MQVIPQSSDPSSALAPYTRHLYELVPNPQCPNLKTESLLSDLTIKTIQLHWQKKEALPPGDT